MKNNKLALTIYPFLEDDDEESKGKGGPKMRDREKEKRKKIITKEHKSTQQASLNQNFSFLVSHRSYAQKSRPLLY